MGQGLEKNNLKFNISFLKRKSVMKPLAMNRFKGHS
jgi:hypothetical protein